MLQRIFRSSWTFYGLAAALGIVAVASQFELRMPSRPVGGVEELRALPGRGDLNVVFVLIDTLRADRLSAYGYERATSPLLADLASSGVRFANVQAQSSWTKCSMASLWTGLYPIRSGVTRAEHALPEAAELPAERLKAAGYRTAGIWRNGWVGSNFGFSQGFDLYVRPTPSQTPEDMERRRRNPGVGALMGTDEDATRSAVEFIRTHGRDRFFLYVHYMDVHQYVYDEAAAKLGWGNRLQDSYDASIHWVDRNVGRLLLELEESRVFERTIFVVASDHGEGFFDHGEGHARTLYQDVTHVPLILALPFRLKPGVVVDSVARNVDLWPTLFDLMGLPPLTEPDGRSLAPLIEAAMAGQDPPSSGDGGTALAYLDQTWGRKDVAPSPLVSAVRGDLRLLVRPERPKAVEFYDRSLDPREQRNLASARPEQVELLRQSVDGALAQKPPWGESPTVELDDFDREQLRALGYVVR